jgi:hypothetical protein
LRAFYQPRPEAEIVDWVSDRQSVTEIARGLAELGLLEVHRRSGGETYWQTTIAGNALAQASFRRPIRRTTAQGHLAAVIERAHRFNADARYLVNVTQIRVFAH